MTNQEVDGSIGPRSSRIFRRLQVERPDADLFKRVGPEALRRHLTVQTHLSGLVHMVMADAHRKP